MIPSDDSELVRAYLDGERHAAAVVDGWIAAAAWPFRRRLCGDWDDLLQEIRMEVLRLLRAGAFRGESRLKTYLWQVACHTCLDAVRRVRRRTFVGLEAVEERTADGASPFDSLARQEGTDLALRALAAQSSECRALWESLLRGQSYREIGRRMGVTEGALRVRAHRCRQCAVAALRAAAAPPSFGEDARAVS